MMESKTSLPPSEKENKARSINHHNTPHYTIRKPFQRLQKPIFIDMLGGFMSLVLLVTYL